jgi:uncharacterized membrane protein YhfC
MAWMTPVIVASAQQREENQLLAQLGHQLGPDWELKILHSMGSFGDWAIIGPVIEEEAAAGWQIVRKLDDSRLVFKRPVSARLRDHLLPPDVDAYRDFYGAAMPTLVGLVMALLLLALVISVVLFAGIG